MILGYILICGFGPLEPGSIEGCKVYTIPFYDAVTCENERAGFLVSPDLRDGHYIDDSGCIVIGTGV